MLPTFNLPPIARYFSYADPAIGGGKTYGLEKHVAHQFTGKSIIAIQSIDLAKEIEKRLTAEGASVLRIDTEAFPYDPSNPTVTCTSILNEALASGDYQALIANQDVVLRADDRFTRDYHLFMDEVTPVHKRYWLNGIVTSHKAIESYMTSRKSGKDNWLRIYCTDAGEKFLETDHLEKMMPSDKELYEVIQKMRDMDNYEFYAEADQYHKLKDGLEQSVVLHSIMKPTVFDKFASATVLGANFLWSLMNLIWSKFYSVEFSLHAQIMAETRYSNLKHKARQTKVFYHTKKKCSKRTYKEVEFQPTFDASHKAVKELLRKEGYPDDTKYLVFLNNPPKGVKKFHWKDENAILLSSAARGWDVYKEQDIAVFLAACNEQPDTYRFLYAFFGLDQDEVDRATALERAYQAVGRCSIRDMDSDRPVILIFFDYRTAKFVSDLIGIENEDGKPIEPSFLNTGLDKLVKKEAKTDSERQKKSTHNKNVKAVGELPNYEGFIRRNWMDLWSDETWNEDHATWADWVAHALDFAQTNEPPSKEKSVMYREGVYKSATDHKVKGNIEMTKIITLDFDDVTGDVGEFSDWMKARFSHLIANSYGSTIDAPRFRIDVPLSIPVNSYGYNHIVAHLIAEIEAEFGDAFIVDKSKKTLFTRFHMPSVSIHGADLFIDGTALMDGQPVFLDVMEYMGHDPIEKAKEEIETDTEAKPVNAHAGSMAIDEVLDKWAVPAGHAKGSFNFHQAAIDLLFKVHLSREETIEVLNVNRYRFGKGDDRDAEYTVDHVLQNREDRAARPANEKNPAIEAGIIL